MVRLVNCTPHTVRVVRENGEVVEIAPSGLAVRVNTVQEIVRDIDGIPVVATRFTDVQLPESQENTVYIVSTVTLQACRELGIQRNDLVSPDTGPQSAVRDETGQIVAIRRFQVL
ncbi:hypothetical protein Calkr_2070 [Caldicellulosiruptor acetigenus I77R1B]|uniref:Uncharacterized protein n=1 Tax=Caldicellulosiruptor acetigenus (strain ATCC 700853 / DSM 12137 / I77R1B) TaxID=632335 RepID=E4S5A5_CALA7|nr:hypothetical protein [Caldicellulosiruptor acetigenus]ADQ41539.1 hypothetical protein Calkr_2070 [Caldicellulosiruptor acetigenus I77R1B]